MASVIHPASIYLSPIQLKIQWLLERIIVACRFRQMEWSSNRKSPKKINTALSTSMHGWNWMKIDANSLPRTNTLRPKSKYVSTHYCSTSQVNLIVLGIFANVSALNCGLVDLQGSITWTADSSEMAKQLFEQ